MDLLFHFSHIAVREHRVDQIFLVGRVGAEALQDRAAVVGQLQQVGGDGGRIVGDDEQRLFLVLLVKGVDHLGVAELEYDGI